VCWGWGPSGTLLKEQGSYNLVHYWGHKGPVLRPRCIGPGGVRTPFIILFYSIHTSLLNTTVVAFKILPLESYALMPAPSPPFKTILELVFPVEALSYKPEGRGFDSHVVKA